MAIHYMQETTDWSGAHANIPNHTYIFDGAKCIGYIKAGTTEKHFFSKPSSGFSKSGRKFKNVTKEWENV